jgi:hypothetical protein
MFKPKEKTLTILSIQSTKNPRQTSTFINSLGRLDPKQNKRKGENATGAQP